MSHTLNNHCEDHHEGHGARAGRRSHFHRGGSHGHGEGRGHGHGHGEGRGHGRGRGGRAGRGDLRSVILLLLAESPMHGYQIISTMSARTDEHWVPSPGAVYPCLSMLEDEGLISISAAEGRKMATLTEEGHTLVAQRQEEWGEILNGYRTPGLSEDSHLKRRAAMRRLREVVRQADDQDADWVVSILDRAAMEISDRKS
ncbi:PadR family transcriptional regulator [Corynebacterium alimapuense]|uniref:PadR family transcriptional regulator n=1 Tax=Corynebacterium alimapuense TaxID=1576874 RepID=A0A3M8K6D2_9CORY|nr:PadR family transcriptional regulator [Corynebacterium alimapuense]RNE48787.1 PadR family transcriptional regulator [Corynebacterium alimapuense]